MKLKFWKRSGSRKAKEKRYGKPTACGKCKDLRTDVESELIYPGINTLM